jgi:hypothetical protein
MSSASNVPAIYPITPVAVSSWQGSFMREVARPATARGLRELTGTELSERRLDTSGVPTGRVEIPGGWLVTWMDGATAIAMVVGEQGQLAGAEALAAFEGTDASDRVVRKAALD